MCLCDLNSSHANFIGLVRGSDRVRESPLLINFGLNGLRAIFVESLSVAHHMPHHASAHHATIHKQLFPFLLDQSSHTPFLRFLRSSKLSKGVHAVRPPQRLLRASRALSCRGLRSAVSVSDTLTRDATRIATAWPPTLMETPSKPLLLRLMRSASANVDDAS